MAIVTVLAAGVGYVFAPQKPTSTEAPKAEAASEASSAAALSVFDLPPVVTNLADPSDVWIRLEASIVIDPKTMPRPEVIGGEIASDILEYLRSTSLTRLEGQIGLQDLKHDLSERANVRSGGKVVELIVRTLVVQ